MHQLSAIAQLSSLDLAAISEALADELPPPRA